MLCVSIMCSYLLLASIPLYTCNRSCLFICHVMNIWIYWDEAVINMHFPLQLSHPHPTHLTFFGTPFYMSSNQKGLLCLLLLKWHFASLSPHLLFHFFKGLSITIIYITRFIKKIYKDCIRILQRDGKQYFYI